MKFEIEIEEEKLKELKRVFYEESDGDDDVSFEEFLKEKIGEGYSKYSELDYRDDVQIKKLWGRDKMHLHNSNILSFLNIHKDSFKVKIHIRKMNEQLKQDYLQYLEENIGDDANYTNEELQELLWGRDKMKKTIKSWCRCGAILESASKQEVIDFYNKHNSIYCYPNNEILNDLWGKRMKTIRQTINDIKKLYKNVAVEFKIKANKTNGMDTWLSGFIKLKEDKYLYVSCHDIRWNSNYRTNILIRTATGYKDFSGGQNIFINLDHNIDNGIVEVLEWKK